MYKIRVFWEKVRFFIPKTWFGPKIVKCCKIAVQLVQIRYYFSKMTFFYLNWVFFEKKIKKFSNVEKLKNLMTKEYLARKKCFRPSKKHVCKSLRAENMLVFLTIILNFSNLWWPVGIHFHLLSNMNYVVSCQNTYLHLENWNESYPLFKCC